MKKNFCILSRRRERKEGGEEKKSIEGISLVRRRHVSCHWTDLCVSLLTLSLKTVFDF
jgi:hypothetical protein